LHLHVLLDVQVYVKTDSYGGLDIRFPMSLKVLKKLDVPVIAPPSQEDEYFSSSSSEEEDYSSEEEDESD
jgi:hypothetical protein